MTSTPHTFQVLSRASSTAVASSELDEEALTEAHWTYMDRYADAMTARGPLLGPDRDSWEGSMHVVDLPSIDAVRAFVDEEPYQRAGLFETHSTWRFVNLLGRTMWEYDDPTDEPRFLVVARPAQGAMTTDPVPVDDLPADLRRTLIVYGHLRGLEDGVPEGLALALQARSREAVTATLDATRSGLAGLDRRDVFDWEFGGRR